MAKTYLRNKKDGFIYEWDEILAANPLCEAVTEEQAFPERFIPLKQVEQVRARRRATNTKLDLTIKDIPEAPQHTAPDLAFDASRGLPG